MKARTRWGNNGEGKRREEGRKDRRKERRRAECKMKQTVERRKADMEVSDA